MNKKKITINEKEKTAIMTITTKAGYVARVKVDLACLDLLEGAWSIQRYKDYINIYRYNRKRGGGAEYLRTLIALRKYKKIKVPSSCNVVSIKKSYENDSEIDFRFSNIDIISISNKNVNRKLWGKLSKAGYKNISATTSLNDKTYYVGAITRNGVKITSVGLSPADARQKLAENAAQFGMKIDPPPG